MMESARSFLEVEIADVSQQIFSGRCAYVVAPAALGEVCILPRHTPFLTKLLPGEVRLETDGGEKCFFFVSGGYMEVQRSSATILADRMLRSEDIDRDAALEAKRNAEALLKESHLFTERDRAKLELVKALAQLRVLDHVRMTRMHKPDRR